MSGRTEIERALDGFLAEGPETVRDHALMRALNAIDRTNQRRGPFASWRFPILNTYTRLAAVAVVAAIAIGGALYLVGPRTGIGGPGPSPSPTAVATEPRSPAATAPAATAFPFTSTVYGYSATYPIGWIHAEAVAPWAQQTNSEMWASPVNAPWVDKTYNNSTGVTMTGVAMPFAAGTKEGPWIEAYLAEPEGSESTCVSLASDMTSIVIDGHPAHLTTKCDERHNAYVIADGRIYVFAISTPSDLSIFTEFLASVRLPEGSPAPS